MRYLAVPEMPRRGFRVSRLRPKYWAPEWHAVAESFPKPTRTLCGLQYLSEALWTWDQTMYGSRCSQCERLVPIKSVFSANASLTGLEGGSRVIVSRLHGRSLGGPVRALVGVVVIGLLILINIPLLVSGHSLIRGVVTGPSAPRSAAAIEAPSPTTTNITTTSVTTPSVTTNSQTTTTFAQLRQLALQSQQDQVSTAATLTAVSHPKTHGGTRQPATFKDTFLPISPVVIDGPTITATTATTGTTAPASTTTLPTPTTTLPTPTTTLPTPTTTLPTPTTTLPTPTTTLPTPTTTLPTPTTTLPTPTTTLPTPTTTVPTPTTTVPTPTTTPTATTQPVA